MVSEFFQLQVTLIYVEGQLGQLLDTKKNTSMSAVKKRHSLVTTVSSTLFIWNAPTEGGLFLYDQVLYYPVMKPSLLFHKELFNFKRGSDLIQLQR